jgi:BACON domain-containing protein
MHRVGWLYPMRYCGLLVVLLLAVDARTASAQCASPSVTPTSVSVPSTGSPPSTLSVVTGTSCPWTASSTVTWITVTGVTGSGLGWVNYVVAANDTSSPRTGTIVVAGLNGSTTVTFNQAANSCTYTVTPTSFTVPTNGTTSALSVSSGTSCSWTAVSNVGWITITSGGSGSGIGSVNFVVAANTGPERTGTLTAAGKTVTFSQGGVPPLGPPTNLRIVR